MSRIISLIERVYMCTCTRVRIWGKVIHNRRVRKQRRIVVSQMLNFYYQMYTMCTQDVLTVVGGQPVRGILPSTLVPRFYGEVAFSDMKDKIRTKRVHTLRRGKSTVKKSSPLFLFPKLPSHCFVAIPKIGECNSRASRPWLDKRRRAKLALLASRAAPRARGEKKSRRKYHILDTRFLSSRERSDFCSICPVWIGTSALDQSVRQLNAQLIH